MIRRHVVPIAACVIVAAACSTARADCTTFNALVARTYGFKPSALDNARRFAKTKAMDSVWDAVHKNKSDLLPCLRTAIETRTNDPYFQFDGGMLLLSVDSSRSAKALQATTLERTDLQDLALADWVRAVTARALDGFNVTRAVEKWMDLPDSAAKYTLPLHSFTATKVDGALFLIGSLPESLATPYLISLARNAQNPNRETALMLLVLQATPESRQFLTTLPRTGFSADARQGIDEYLRQPPRMAPVASPRVSRNDFVRAFEALRAGNPAPFFSLVDKAPDGEKDAATVLTPDDLPLVRFARRFFVAAGTPEAIGYYKDFTGIIETISARAGRGR